MDAPPAQRAPGGLLKIVGLGGAVLLVIAVIAAIGFGNGDDPGRADSVATPAAPQSTAAPTVVRTATSTPAPVPAPTYVVQPGDTLFGIAARFGTTTENLVELNNISDPSVIEIGQVLTLSAAPAAPAAPATPAASAPRATSTALAAAASSPDALTMMVAVFIGDPSRTEIKRELEIAMRHYGLAVTEDNRVRGGSVLVALRQSTGIPEMDILSYMNRSYVPGVSFSFGEMAALSATLLQLGAD